MGDYLRKQYDDMCLEPQDKESLYEKIISFICSFLFILALVLWTVKGLEYLTEKTRQVRLDADYTEQMLKMYRN